MTNLNINKINQIIAAAKKQPFVSHYVIAKDKLLLEEAFLKRTGALFNIEIITYNELIAVLKDRFSLNYLKPVNQLDGLVFLRRLLLANYYATFANPSYDTCANLQRYLVDLYNYECDFAGMETLAQLSQNKLREIETIFELYLNHLDSKERIGFEDDLISRFDATLKDNHFYFFFDHYNVKQTKLIRALKELTAVEVLDYSSYSDSDLADHLQSEFFTSDAACELTTPYVLWPTGTTYQQYRLLANEISTKINREKMAYHDFAIIVNNPSDKLAITSLLEEFEIPSNGVIEAKNNSYEALGALARYYATRDDKTLLGFLTNPAVISATNEHDIVNFYKTDQIDASLLEGFKLNDGMTIKAMTDSLITFIKDSLVTDQNTLEIISALEQLQSYSDSIAIRDYFDLVFITVSNGPTKTPVLSDHVYILELASPLLELLEIKTAYVVNFNENNIPMRIKNNQLLLDDELAQLNLPTIKEQMDRENSQVLSLYCSQIENMIFCCPANSLSGDTLLMASVLKNLIERYGHDTKKIATFFTHPKLKDNMYVHHRYDANETFLNQTISNFTATKNQPGTVDFSHKTGKLSPSQLELYNSCAYKYFLQYIAKIDKFATARMQANHIGSYIHSLIESAKEFIEEFDRDRLISHLNRVSAEYFEDHQFEPNSYNRLLARRILEDLPTTIAILNRQYQLGSCQIMATEKYTSLELEQLALHGKIDRVNNSKEFIDVIDYKGSKKSLKDDLLKLGVNIQMLLYLYMVAQEQNLQPGGVFYFNYAPSTIATSEPISTYELDSNAFLKEHRLDSLINEAHVDDIDDIEPQSDSLVFKGGRKKDGSFKANAPLKTPAELDELFSAILSYVGELDGRMKKGDISIRPIISDLRDKEHLKPCTYCDYKTICNFDIFYNEYRDLSKEVNQDEPK